VIMKALKKRRSKTGWGFSPAHQAELLVGGTDRKSQVTNKKKEQNVKKGAKIVAGAGGLKTRAKKRDPIGKRGKKLGGPGTRGSTTRKNAKDHARNGGSQKI